MILRKLMRGAALALAAFSFAPAPHAAPAAQPFFLYGASFFYERVPRDRWAQSLQRYRALGINTIDLYVMWNWHELRDGDFDFTGRTNPRRDLVGLLTLIHDDGFHIVLRPGPVIRNEWRNGGYPAWLLTRPEYRMPARDVLEGRYAATATFQNQHADAAAAEWLNNSTHMRYATRWLRRALQTAAPWKNDIAAVALDDDQGAYLDNDTWPAPHFHRYIQDLAATVHGVLGPSMPVFINTFQMKVTASAPVWTWGNWYQSDAYSIGEHDRSQIEFSTGLLQTQSPRRPIMISEFQAGWLQGADQAFPRAADPTNTTLALHTLLQMGAHGVVNFPVQDTLNPAGWEAPWTNAFYSWDAALSVQLSPQARFSPTARFGNLMRTYGAELVQTHPIADAAVAYLTSAYPIGSLRSNDVAQIAQATIEAQRGCRIMRITCALVDLRYASTAQLQSFPTLIVPQAGIPQTFDPAVKERLEAFRAGGGKIVTSARAAKIPHPAAGGIPNAVLLADDSGSVAFVDIVNYTASALHTRAARVHAGTHTFDVPATTVARRDAVLLPLTPDRQEGSAGSAGSEESTASQESQQSGDRLPLRPNAFITAQLRPVRQDEALAYASDVYSDGYPAVVLENDAVRVIVSPCAGARALIFEDKHAHDNVFTTIGGLRDAWSPQLAPSPRDYIAKYTHPIATGTFNRCYAYRVENGNGAASATFAYTAPDAPPHGAAFRRTIRLRARGASFEMQTTVHFLAGRGERALQITSFALAPKAAIVRVKNGYGIFDPVARCVALVAWRSGIAAAKIEPHPGDALLTLTYAAGNAAVEYGLSAAATAAQAQAALARFANRGPSS